MRELFPTLSRVVRLLESENGNGLCFHRSAALCYDLPHSILCVGTLSAATDEDFANGAPDYASREPFLHCWVEFDGNVFAPTTIEHFGKLQAMERPGYYRLNGVLSVNKMPRSKLLQIFKSNPSLLIELQTGIPAKKLLVDTLLKKLKVPFKLSERNGVLPA